MTISVQLYSKFHLPPEIIKQCDKYYILYWQASHIWSVTSIHGTLVRERIEYIPIWEPPCSMTWVGENPEKTVRLSFRKLKHHKTGYVLIQIAPSKQS
jgi:hypothetical protein